MCGIFAIFESSVENEELRKKALAGSKKLRHRGPDWSGVVIVDNNNAIAHERLAIMDPESGEQPLTSKDGKVVLAANGEIYNYKELRAGLKEPYDFKTGSDCEVLIPLFQQEGIGFLNKLRGMFAFVLYDGNSGEYIAVRDHMVICPLYMGWSADGSVVFASEMKALTVADYASEVSPRLCNKFEIFPPGSVYMSKERETKRWYEPSWFNEKHIGTEKLDLAVVRDTFEMAVKRRMMTDVPWGVLLSGGLDSSLVASIACRMHKEAEKTKAFDKTRTVFPAMHSFTIGLEGSPDLIAAQKVADFLGTVHHSYTFTVQEGVDAISDVIYHLETYDTTTIRSATPMFLMSRKIKSLGIKMILSGEGADELWGGYLYFHKAPNPQEFHDETREKLQKLHLFDNLRANKSTAAWGLEARVPFLDYDVIEQGMNVDAKEKMCQDRGDGRGSIEKWIVRKAFDTKEDPYLPDEILWRQKEQFSDGVGYSWIDGLRDLAEESVSDLKMKNAKHLFPHNTPPTKENYMYRSIFERHYPSESSAKTVPGGKSIACSTERVMSWDSTFEAMADASGRSILGVHVDGKDQVNVDSKPAAKKAKR